MNLINEVLQACGLYFVLALPFLYINFLRKKAKDKREGAENEIY